MSSSNEGRPTIKSEFNNSSTLVWLEEIIVSTKPSSLVQCHLWPDRKKCGFDYSPLFVNELFMILLENFPSVWEVGHKQGAFLIFNFTAHAY